MKKLLCLLLVIAMVAIPLISCADDSGKTPGNDPSKIPTDSGNADGDTFVLPANFQKYDNTPFHIIFETKKNWGFYEMDFEEDPGADDAYGHALYLRNTNVEDLLGISIEFTSYENADSTQKAFNQDSVSQSNDFHATFNTLQFEMNDLVAGNLLSFDNIPHVDLTKSWWNHDCTEQLSILGKSYVNSGDIMLSDKEVLWAVYFMKNIVEQLQLDDPYVLVENNEWTWDKMLEMADRVADDTNMDDVMTVGNDRFGLLTHSENWAASWESAGVKLIEMDKSGVPHCTWDSEEFTVIHDKIKEVMGNKQLVGVDTPENIQAAFLKNQTLFCTEVIAFVRYFNSSENSYGILPYPKYNSDVERFNTYVALNSAGVIVSYTTSEAEYIGLVLEAMAAEGQKTVRPRYIDDQLKSRYSDDENAAKMLEIIFDFRCYDLSIFLDTKYSGKTALSSESATPARLVATQMKMANNNLNGLMQTLLERE